MYTMLGMGNKWHEHAMCCCDVIFICNCLVLLLCDRTSSQACCAFSTKHIGFACECVLKMFVVLFVVTFCSTCCPFGVTFWDWKRFLWLCNMRIELGCLKLSLLLSCICICRYLLPTMPLDHAVNHLPSAFIQSNQCLKTFDYKICVTWERKNRIALGRATVLALLRGVFRLG